MPFSAPANRPERTSSRLELVALEVVVSRPISAWFEPGVRDPMGAFDCDAFFRGGVPFPEGFARQSAPMPGSEAIACHAPWARHGDAVSPASTYRPKAHMALGKVRGRRGSGRMQRMTSGVGQAEGNLRQIFAQRDCFMNALISR